MSQKCLASSHTVNQNILRFTSAVVISCVAFVTSATNSTKKLKPSRIRFLYLVSCSFQCFIMSMVAVRKCDERKSLWIYWWHNILNYIGRGIYKLSIQCQCLTVPVHDEQLMSMVLMNCFLMATDWTWLPLFWIRQSWTVVLPAWCIRRSEKRRLTRPCRLFRTTVPSHCSKTSVYRSLCSQLVRQ